MGEVYRATDTRLGRDVALKLLPEAFASDPDRLARFEREAKLLAPNHPGIAHLYGFESVALADGTKANVLVMELVEGEDLAERLKRGPLPVDEAVAVARQVAEALEEAHEKGVVHRDLKPANVKLTPDGKVKVLDFGLAKAWSGNDDSRSGSAPALSQSPTLARTGTAAGLILGTAAYMSPEQARGKAADRRADIWSFGVLLYELLVGRRLFDGETVSDVLASVLTREPDFTALPKTTPAHVEELLRRCLVRDPHDRLQSIGDARIALQGAPLLAPTGLAPKAARRRRSWAWVPWALAGLFAVALALLWRRPAAVGDVVTAAIPPPPGTAFDLRGRGPGPVALSHRGGRGATAAQARDAATLLYVRAIADGRTTEYPGSAGAQFPFWSPDGRWIAFFSRSDGKLKKVPVEGGAPLTICRALNGKGGSWGRDDVIVLSPSSGTALHHVPASGGEPVPFTQLANPYNSHRHPRFLPDGRRFLFLARSGEAGQSAVLLGSVDGSPPREVVRSATQAEYASGHLLFVRESVLMAQPFDLAAGTVNGEARPVADGVLEIQAAAFAAFSASGSGRVVFHSGESQAPVRIELRDRKGSLLRSLGTPGMYRSPSISPDGRWLAATGHPQVRDGNHDVWLFALEGESTIRFTIEPSEDVDVAWAPDGKALFYGANAKGRRVPQEPRRDPRGRAPTRRRGCRNRRASRATGRSCWSTRRWTSGTSWSWSTSRPGAPGGSARARGATGTGRCRRTGGGCSSSPTKPADRRSTSRPSRDRDGRSPSRPTAGATRTGAGTGARSSTPPSTAGSWPRRRFPRATPSGSARPWSSSGRCRPSATTGSGACRATRNASRSSPPASSRRGTSCGSS
jgi:Tol biopolymer transport system component